MTAPFTTVIAAETVTGAASEIAETVASVEGLEIKIVTYLRTVSRVRLDGTVDVAPAFKGQIFGMSPEYVTAINADEPTYMGPSVMTERLSSAAFDTREEAIDWLRDTLDEISGSNFRDGDLGTRLFGAMEA